MQGQYHSSSRFFYLQLSFHDLNCPLQVIAGLYTNAPLALSVLEKTQFPTANEPITIQFITQWLKDTDCFLGLVLSFVVLLILPDP